jgi:hypothetical protein
MALVLEILLGVAILASFFIAYMSARTWPVYQVVLLVFVFLGGVAFFYLGARTLATHRAWGTLVNNQKAEIERIETQTKELREGGPADAEGVRTPKGIRQLQQDWQKLTFDRGGVIYDAAVDGVKDGVVQLTLKSADHGLTVGTVAYAFGQGAIAEGGRYLGEFKVSLVGEDATKVQITPNLPLTEEQAKRLAGAKGPLALYMRMPIDDAAMYAALDEPTRQKLLPAASLAEFAKADRKLRDYDQIFHEHFVQRSLLTDGINKLTANIERMTAATKEAEKEAAYRETEKTKLAADLEKFQHERKVIADYQQSLSKFYQQVRERLRATYLDNRRMADDLTAGQLRAADEIDRADASASVRPARPPQTP